MRELSCDFKKSPFAKLVVDARVQSCWLIAWGTRAWCAHLNRFLFWLSVRLCLASSPFLLPSLVAMSGAAPTDPYTFL